MDGELKQSETFPAGTDVGDANFRKALNEMAELCLRLKELKVDGGEYQNSVTGLSIGPFAGQNASATEATEVVHGKITGNTGNAYTIQPVSSTITAGAVAWANDGSTYTAYEINGWVATMPADLIVEIKERADTAGGTMKVFTAPMLEPATRNIITVNGSGNYLSDVPRFV